MPRQTKEDLMVQIDMLNIQISNLEAENIKVREAAIAATQEREELFEAMKERIGLLESVIETFEDEAFYRYRLDQNSDLLEKLTSSPKKEVISKLVEALGASGAFHIGKDQNGQVQMKHIGPGK